MSSPGQHSSSQPEGGPPGGYMPAYYPYYAYQQQMPGMYQVYYPQGFDPMAQTPNAQDSSQQMTMQQMQQYQMSMYQQQMAMAARGQSAGYYYPYPVVYPQYAMYQRPGQEGKPNEQVASQQPSSSTEPIHQQQPYHHHQHHVQQQQQYHQQQQYLHQQQYHQQGQLHHQQYPQQPQQHYAPRQAYRPHRRYSADQQSQPVDTQPSFDPGVDDQHHHQPEIESPELPIPSSEESITSAPQLLTSSPSLETTVSDNGLVRKRPVAFSKDKSRWVLKKSPSREQVPVVIEGYESAGIQDEATLAHSASASAAAVVDPTQSTSSSSKSVSAPTQQPVPSVAENATQAKTESTSETRKASEGRSAWGTVLPQKKKTERPNDDEPVKELKEPSSDPKYSYLDVLKSLTDATAHVGDSGMKDGQGPRYLEISRKLKSKQSVGGLNLFRVAGMKNPKDLELCYLNSVILVLLPVTPLMSLLTNIANTHSFTSTTSTPGPVGVTTSTGTALTSSSPLISAGAGPWGKKKLASSNSITHSDTLCWTRGISKAVNQFYSQSHGSGNLLKCMQDLIEQKFGLGVQHDMSEALSIVLEGLHRELSWPMKSGGDVTGISTGMLLGGLGLKEGKGLEKGLGLNEDSPIYRLFRGLIKVTEISGDRLEMFLTLQLAPNKKATDLQSLLSDSFANSNANTTSGKSIIMSYPPVLLIELSRHSNDQRQTMNQSSVSFPGVLEVANQSGGVRKYELVSVVMRSGVYSDSGHYWVAQRNNEDWHMINDEEVTKLNITKDILTNKNAVSTALDANTNWSLLMYLDTQASVSLVD